MARPEDISNRYTTDAIYFRRWFYADYNFTLSTLWSPFLVRASDADLSGHSNNGLMSLYLDKPDEAWVSEIVNFDFVIISAANWFFRPLLFYQNAQLVGCHKCNIYNITNLAHYYGYRKAFQTTFRTILNLKGYKGVTFLRTFSPAHFENADWDKGGSCERTRPYTKEEMKFDGYIFETYVTQVEEFVKAEEEARKKGLLFLMLNTTEMMLRRPDGHPNNHVYGSNSKNVNHNNKYNDCVHWCLPGPIDTWNELLLYVLEMQSHMKSFISIQRFV